jgi:hypothetical protein
MESSIGKRMRIVGIASRLSESGAWKLPGLIKHDELLSLPGNRFLGLMTKISITIYVRVSFRGSPQKAGSGYNIITNIWHPKHLQVGSIHQNVH